MGVIPGVLESVSIEVRLMAAYIDAHLSGSMAVYESAVLRERDFYDREGWNLSKTEWLMKRRGWRDSGDIYDEAGIPEKHRAVLELDVRGFEDKEIAKFLGHPLNTVQIWLFRGRERLRRLDLRDLG